MKKKQEADNITNQIEIDEEKAFVKACKNTKHLDGKHKGKYKSGRTCRAEWASSRE